MRGEHQWKQLERREEIRHKRSQTPVSELPESFFSIINPYLDRLKEFVRKVISFAEARGDLAPGQLTTDEVVDATLIDAYGDYLLNPTPGNIQAWLIRLATKQIANEIKQTQFEREHIAHIEEDVPETPPRKK